MTDGLIGANFFHETPVMLLSSIPGAGSLTHCDGSVIRTEFSEMFLWKGYSANL